MRENLHSFDAAIIDLDGTMVDTMGDFVVAINLMLGDLGYDAIDASIVALKVGKGSENLVNSVLNNALANNNIGLSAINKEALLARAVGLYQQHYRRINGQNAQVYPGVVAGLRAMQAAGLKLACLTNKPLAFANELLHLKGLAEYFSHAFGGDSFERKKPDPLPVIKTCLALGSPPTRTLVVGDSSNDAQAARAAGCPVVLVTYGYNHGMPIASAGADATVNSLLELLPLLDLKVPNRALVQFK